jgi:hypothetical protein
MAKKVGAKKRSVKIVPKKDPKKRHAPAGSFRLVADSIRLLVNNWRVLGGIMAVYLALNLLFANGLTGLNHSLNTVKKGSGSSSIFGSSVNSGQQTGSFFQTALLVIGSLVIIWALRQLFAGNKITIKEAYYKSMGPLIPFLLIVLVIILQLLPMSLGAAGLAVVLTSVLNSTLILGLIFMIIFAMLTIWSLYMLTSSIFALYIVTLPDMQPRHALRSAKELVDGRRWVVLRRMLFLPLLILLTIGILVVPAIWIYAPLAVGLFYLIAVAAILFAHTYLYSLYRSLI